MCTQVLPRPQVPERKGGTLNSTRSTIAFAFVTALVILLALALWKAPDPWTDQDARLLDRYGLLTEGGLQLKQLFPDAIVVTENMAVRCVKQPGQQFGVRQLLKASGDVVEYRGWGWCWR